MRKIWTIAWKELYMTFSDRNLVVIMIAAPLAISTIIGLAFGGLGGGDVPIKDIPVAIVNQDSGSGGQNYGDIFVNAFIPPATAEGGNALPACPLVEETAASSTPTTLDNLTNTVKLDDVAAARAGVDDGTYTAAIIIPADFSQQIGYSGPTDPVEPVGVEVYANSGRAVPAGIIRSIVESIGNQIATGNIAIATTFDTIGAQYGFAAIGQIANSDSFSENVACAFTPVFNTLKIEQETIAGEASNSTIAILVIFGSAQAMFFTLFTGQQGVLSIFDERKQWTLQRLIVTPTPRLYILLGKLVGTFVTCFVQLVALFIFLTIVGSLMSGGFVQIWGDHLGLVLVVILAASLMSTGLGTLLAGIARTPEQSAIIAQLINLAMAFLGGAFGFQLPESIARFSLLYWGTNAFQKLASNQTDIWLNVLVLSAFGVVLFGIGFWFFNRRLDI
jgi:ABC-type transport system involved in multi-copper enzyme maturation permease subunit